MFDADLWNVGVPSHGRPDVGGFEPAMAIAGFVRIRSFGVDATVGFNISVGTGEEEEE